MSHLSAEEKRDRVNARQRVRYAKNPKAHMSLQRNPAGVTNLERELIVAEHGDYCDICSATVPGSQGWHLDHDHTTGRIRGVLCQKCNTGLGLFCDSPVALRNAANYLELQK